LENLWCPFNGDSVDNPETAVTADLALLLPRFKLRDKFPLTLFRCLHKQSLDSSSVSKDCCEIGFSLEDYDTGFVLWGLGREKLPRHQNPDNRQPTQNQH